MRDRYPEVMDQYLTNGSRSIPIVIVLDEYYHEIGHWGPRPTELQAWVMANRATMPKTELYPQVRKWYARDRGETTIREVLEARGCGCSGAAGQERHTSPGIVRGRPPRHNGPGPLSGSWNFKLPVPAPSPLSRSLAAPLPRSPLPRCPAVKTSTHSQTRS